jgi:hypothetical protein
MPEEQASDLIWASLPGSSQLREIYGYWPTLHDATATEWDVRFQDNSFSITFIYSDMIGEDPSNTASTQFTLRWRGVQEAKFRYYANAIYHLSSARVDRWIETQFEDHLWGLDGYIRSSRVEVLNIQNAPDSSSEPENSPTLYRTNFYFHP